MTTWTQCPCLNNIKKDFSKPLILRNVKLLSIFFFPAIATSDTCLMVSSLVKLPVHPVRTGQGRRGFPEMKYHSYCAPLPRLPAYRQALDLAWYRAGRQGGACGRLPASLDGCFFSQLIPSMNREIPHFSELRMVG